MGSNFNISNCCSPFIIKPTDLKLHEMIENGWHYDYSISVFFQFPVTWPRNLTRGSKCEIIYLPHYWTSEFQTSQNYTELTYVTRLYDVIYPDFQSCNQKMKLKVENAIHILWSIPEITVSSTRGYYFVSLCWLFVIGNGVAIEAMPWLHIITLIFFKYDVVHLRTLCLVYFHFRRSDRLMQTLEIWCNLTSFRQTIFRGIFTFLWIV